MEKKAFIEVSIVTTVMFGITFMGLFDSVFTENGPDHYAERYGWLGVWTDVMPMPLNTVVNLAYTAVGIMWLRRLCQNKGNILNCANTFTLAVFNWMAVFYSVIQLARLLTQEHRWAVMDQWYTLPFFAWTVILAYTIENGRSRKLEVGIIFLSLVSYCGALSYQFGFDISLGCHILIAVYYGGIQTYKKYDSANVRYYMIMSYVACTAFIVLKVLDHELPKFHSIFTIITGHFLSKIADFMQIYYVNSFMVACIEVRHLQELKTK